MTNLPEWLAPLLIVIGAALVLCVTINHKLRNMDKRMPGGLLLFVTGVIVAFYQLSDLIFMFGRIAGCK